jgi:hypothetical protein
MPRPTPRPPRRTALRRLSDRELEQRLQAARAPTLAELARQTRPLRREWLRRQAARPVDGAAAAREVGRLIEAAEQRGAAEAPRVRGAALGRRNAGRTRRAPPHHALIRAAYEQTRKKSWRAVLVQLRRTPGVTIDDGEEQIIFGTTRPISFKTLENLVGQLRRLAR